VRDEAQPFHPTGRVEKDGYLMRVSRKEESALIWEDQVWRTARPQRKAVKVVVDAVTLERLKGSLQSHLFLVPASIGKKRGQRPLAVYALMIADSNSGFILGTVVMSAQDSLPAMHSRIPNSLAQMLVQAEILPQKLVVRSELLRTLLKPFAQALNIELRLQDELPSIDEAAEYMGQFMRGGKL
jgi:hypothetical protein